MGNPEQLPPAVLIVEDDADAQANLRDFLELDGYEVKSACTFREALKQERPDQFAAILLDRKLPDGSGDDLLPHFRKKAPNTPVVVISAYANLDGATIALEHGAAEFLPKPFEPEILRFHLSRIREQHQMRTQLTETQQRLLQSERLAAIGQTITVICHESGNKLSMLRLLFHLLPANFDHRERFLEMIGEGRQCVDDMIHLFKDIRGFAAPLQLEIAPCNLRTIWRNAWLNLKSTWEDREVEFDDDIGNGNVTVSGDAFRLEQVFRNLFENCLAACTSEPVAIQISCSLPSGKNASLTVAIRDNGPGLPQEDSQKIFNAFFTTKSEGTGLGLAIVKRIIDAHGGTIRVSDENIQGAEFLITLPI